MTKVKDIKSGTDISKFPVLGTYDGECADATITNNNGLDITRPVWENVFNSDDFKKAIKLGWYIGYLGHPENPNCMDFKNACIVMTEGHIDESGKVYGKFNLIDTPVGRIVKAFQDAGVVFGISVRGAGDIVGNSVDSDTFIFRGFDLVTFPAYPDSIPEFTAIAASTDRDVQIKYKNVCKAVKENVSSITSCEAIDVIQSQFAAQSDEYKSLEDRKSEISDSDDNDTDSNIYDQKLDAMTKLYLEEADKCKQLALELDNLKRSNCKTEIACTRKLKAIRRICAAQIMDLTNANNELTKQNSITSATNKRLKFEIEAAEKINLKYKRKVDATSREAEDKESIMCSMKAKFDETVNENKQLKATSSNLDAKIRELKSEITAAHKLITEYQNAYSNMYANALGIQVKSLPITACTSVSELQDIIGSSSNANNSNVFVEPDSIDVVEDDDEIITL